MPSTRGGPTPAGPPATPAGIPPAGLVFPLFFLSGAVGLVYQVVWLRQLILVFGATAYASSAVLSTFMGGLALGSLWAARNADRWKLPPLRAYGALELGVASYAALIPFLLHASRPLLGVAWRAGAGEHFLAFGLLKFAVIAVLILPATTLMGATLPVLSRVAKSYSSSLGGGVGALYAVNTFGAVAGTVGAAFFVLPSLGMERTLFATLFVNAGVGLTAWWRGGMGASPQEAPGAEVPESSAPADRARLGTVIVVFAASGFAAMVLEVAWTRGLALVLGSSVYAYAAMLTAFLVGLAAGAAAAARALGSRRIEAGRALAVTLVLAGLFAFATTYVLQLLPRAFGEIYFRLSPGPNAWLFFEVLLSLAVMAPATFALGWVFPLVLEIAGAGRGVAASVGRVYAANTLGTIAGAATGGFLAIPFAGVANTLVGVAVTEILLGAVVFWRLAPLPPRRRPAAAIACAGIAVLCVAGRPAWNVLLMNSGVYFNVQNVDPAGGWRGFLKTVRRDNQLVYAKDGLTATVIVARQPEYDNLYLSVNGKIDASSKEDLETQIMAGHLPLLFHPNPKDVLIVGLASGMSAGSAATHDVRSIRVVEVEAAMVGAARCFASSNNHVLDDPRVHVSINDARNELEFNPQTYDVIVSEPSNPWMTVASNLFTEEFFRIAKARLREDGVFGQWLQTYCLPPRDVRAVLSAFRSAFPHVLVFDTLDGVDLLLVGSRRPLRIDRDTLRKRMSDLRVRMDMARVDIRSPEDILGMLQTGGPALDRVLEGAPRNTDDNGLVEFSAPKTLYLDSQDANIAMLEGKAKDPLDIVRALTDDPGPEDDLRMAMIERWIWRDEKPRARRAVPFFVDPARREEAVRLLSRKSSKNR